MAVRVSKKNHQKAAVTAFENLEHAGQDDPLFNYPQSWLA
jgi:hypothetical protein